MKTYKQLQERINMAKAKMGDVIKDFKDSDAPQFKGKSDEKRREMAIAAKMSYEENELDEKFQVHYYNKKGEHVNSSSIFGDKVKADAHAKRGNSIDQAGGKYVVKNLANEEVEQIDELSKATMGSYIKKAIPDAEHKEYWGRADRPTKGQRQYLKSAKNRRQGINKAIDKLTKEDTEQTHEELKGDQHKIDANKNGKVDGHDFKLLRGKKK